MTPPAQPPQQKEYIITEDELNELCFLIPGLPESMVKLWNNIYARPINTPQAQQEIPLAECPEVIIKNNYRCCEVCPNVPVKPLFRCNCSQSQHDAALLAAAKQEWEKEHDIIRKPKMRFEKGNCLPVTKNENPDDNFANPHGR